MKLSESLIYVSGIFIYIFAIRWLFSYYHRIHDPMLFIPIGMGIIIVGLLLYEIYIKIRI